MISTFLLFASFSLTAKETLKVAGLQLFVNDSLYESEERFFSLIGNVVDSIPPVDLIILPEYTSAYLGLTITENLNKEGVQESSHQVREIMDRNWGNLALKKKCYILAGTYLTQDHEGNILNKAVIYAPNGQAWYEQNKIFPGDPEKEHFNMTDGNPETISIFKLKNKTIFLTICRDTYSRVWEKHLREEKIDLWIDIKANELPYTNEYFQQALRNRLYKLDNVKYGITVPLNGEVAGYHFEGKGEWITPGRETRFTETEYGVGFIINEVK